MINRVGRGAGLALAIVGLAGWSGHAAEPQAGPLAGLRSALLFHASWDRSMDADVAKGDRKIYTTPTVKHETFTPGVTAPEVSLTPQGRWGGALAFAKDIEPVITYKGKGNMGYRAQDYDVTISFWMSTDLATLPALYIDPFQVYDRNWNDGAIWVDFPTNPPAPNRVFRLAVPSDAQHWNPDNTHINAMPRERQPMFVVERPPFAPGKWTHVAMVIEGINSSAGMSEAKLYLDGQLQGVFEKDIRITWNEENVAMMVGIKYVGRLDDLAIFDRALDRHQVAALMRVDGGVRNLR